MASKPAYGKRPAREQARGVLWDAWASVRGVADAFARRQIGRLFGRLGETLAELAPPSFAETVAAEVREQENLFVSRRLAVEMRVLRKAFLSEVSSGLNDVLGALDRLRLAAREGCFHGLYALYRAANLNASDDGTEGIARLEAASGGDEPVPASLGPMDAAPGGDEPVPASLGPMDTAHSEADPNGNVPLNTTHESGGLAANTVPGALSGNGGFPHAGDASVSDDLTGNIHPDEADTPDLNAGNIKAAAALFSFPDFESVLLAACDGFVLSAAAEAQTLFAETDESRAVFLAALDKEADSLFDQDKLLFNRSVYRFQRLVSDEGFLTDEMIDLFERLLRGLPGPEGESAEDEAKEQTAGEGKSPAVHQADAAQSHASAPDGPLADASDAERDILAGIRETVEIKIDSLRDNALDFAEAGKRLAQEYRAGFAEAGYDRRLEAYNRVLDMWEERMADAGQSAVDEFFSACADEPFIREPMAARGKREAQYAEKFVKLLTGYKKNVLLTEINTYEEVLTYSVSRLRGSTHETVRRAVEILDGTQNALEMLLKKNNISPIKPAPHEMFDPRAHEVLMAEKQEGFQKGEIIKLLANGYRMRDAVLLRAHVIAAR